MEWIELGWFVGALFFWAWGWSWLIDRWVK